MRLNKLLEFLLVLVMLGFISSGIVVHHVHAQYIY
jgi:hypothetical protein